MQTPPLGSPELSSVKCWPNRKQLSASFLASSYRILCPLPPRHRFIIFTAVINMQLLYTEYKTRVDMLTGLNPSPCSTGGFAWPTSQHFCRSPQLRISPSSSFCCSVLFHDPEFLNHQLLHFTCIVFPLMSQPVRKFIVPLLPAQRQLAREPPQAPYFQHLSSEALLNLPDK